MLYLFLEDVLNSKANKTKFLRKISKEYQRYIQDKKQEKQK